MDSQGFLRCEGTPLPFSALFLAIRSPLVLGLLISIWFRVVGSRERPLLCSIAGTRHLIDPRSRSPFPVTCYFQILVYFCCGFTVESVCLLFCWGSRCWAGQACVRAMSALGLENSGRSLAFSFLPLLCCFTLAGQGRARFFLAPLLRVLRVHGVPR